MNSLIAIILLIVFPSFVVSQIQSQFLSRFTKLDLPSTSISPDAVAFDPFGGGPYTGISDGTVVKYNGSRFLDVYITSPNRSKIICEGNQNSSRAVGFICGRPLGLEFYKLRNELYITDAYRGLLVATPSDRLALPVPINGNAPPFFLLNSLDIDQFTGDIYFTDASSRFDISQIPKALAVNDSTGRLLKYTRRTKQVTVLLANITGAAGIALSPDLRFLLFAEYLGKRINKFWLSGPKAFQSETIHRLKGLPEKIKRVPIYGGYWVAVSEISSSGTVPRAIKIDENGKILQSFDLSKEYPNTSIGEFQQRGLRYYVGSIEAGFLGVYN